MPLFVPNHSYGVEGSDYTILQPDPNVPLCPVCKQGCVVKTAKKEGPNQNRRFWVCSKNPSCKGSFRWMDAPQQQKPYYQDKPRSPNNNYNSHRERTPSPKWNENYHNTRQDDRLEKMDRRIGEMHDQVMALVQMVNDLGAQMHNLCHAFEEFNSNGKRARIETENKNNVPSQNNEKKPRKEAELAKKT